MDSRKRRRLAAAGWSIGGADAFLNLSPEEARFIELKLALGASLRAERLRQDLTQAELAGLLGSSQSRVARMEAGDAAVTIDLQLKALLALGLTRQQLSKAFARS